MKRETAIMIGESAAKILAAWLLCVFGAHCIYSVGYGFPRYLVEHGIEAVEGLVELQLELAIGGVSVTIAAMMVMAVLDAAARLILKRKEKTKTTKHAGE